MRIPQEAQEWLRRRRRVVLQGSFGKTSGQLPRVVWRTVQRASQFDWR